MLRKCTDEDISDEECEKVIDPFYDKKVSLNHKIWNLLFLEFGIIIFILKCIENTSFNSGLIVFILSLIFGIFIPFSLKKI